MAFDGAAEAAAINAKLEALSEPWLEGVPDDEELPRNFAGAILPIRIVSYGTPVPLARGRGIGVSEQGQPYTYPFIITHLAPSAAEARVLSQGTSNAFVGFIPNGPNSGEIKATGGHSFQVLATQTKPSHWRVVNYYEVYINAEVAEL